MKEVILRVKNHRGDLVFVASVKDNNCESDKDVVELGRYSKEAVEQVDKTPEEVGIGNTITVELE